jgi:glycosyltransferase involved in cell wall biosynthesis
MAMGVPVVAYDIPGVDQLVKHEHTGLLAPHGDKKSLSDCCQRLLDDPQLAERLVQNARTLIEQHYSAARMALEYEVIFQEMTGGAHKVAPSTGRAI